jgi:hypothetical protein
VFVLCSFLLRFILEALFSFQIDFILTPKVDSRCCKEGKVILGEILTTQQKFVVLDICIRRWK